MDGISYLDGLAAFVSFEEPGLVIAYIVSATSDPAGLPIVSMVVIYA